MDDSRNDSIGIDEGHTPARRTGGGIILAGGVLIALAYWVLPVATLPLIGSVSAPTLSAQASSTASFGLLRLVPLTVLVAIAAGVWLLARPTGRAAAIATVVALGCAGVTALAYLVPLAKVDDALDSVGADTLGIEATNLTGLGFWVALIGVAVTALGAITELVRRRSGRREATRHPG
jgi:hypothetical protein